MALFGIEEMGSGNFPSSPLSMDCGTKSSE